MSLTIMAASLELAKSHGRVYATHFLRERGVAIEVIRELLPETNHTQPADASVERSEFVRDVIT
jgi:hypothetical protein